MLFCLPCEGKDFTRERISIIIPAHNEAERIGATVRSVIKFAEEIIVVDDGSKDETALEAKRAGARVLRLRRNMGKGFALLAGFAVSKGEILLLLDADLGCSAKESFPLLIPILKGEADMTIADLPTKKGGFGLVLGLSRFGVKLLTGRKMRAPISGQRAIRREILEGFPWERGFGFETALTIYGLKKGYRISEIPLPLEHRRTGKSLKGFLHRGKQFLQILIALIKSSIRIWQ